MHNAHTVLANPSTHRSKYAVLERVPARRIRHIHFRPPGSRGASSVGCTAGTQRLLRGAVRAQGTLQQRYAAEALQKLQWQYHGALRQWLHVPSLRAPERPQGFPPAAAQAPAYGA